MNYFTNTPQTLEELKKAYRQLAFAYHPDNGGNAEEMKMVNAEYEKLFNEVKESCVNAKGVLYSKETAETPEHFINIINELIKFEGVFIEIIGAFIWCSGNTKPYKEQFKQMGFKWSANKYSWYLAPEGYKKRNRQKFSLTDIRNKYGSIEIETNLLPRLAIN